MAGAKDYLPDPREPVAEGEHPAKSGTFNPRPDPDVLWRRLDDEVILMQLKTDRIFSLNRTGARFWELIAAGLPLNQITETLLREFAVAPELLTAEIEQVLELLVAEQLLMREER